MHAHINIYSFQKQSNFVNVGYIRLQIGEAGKPIHNSKKAICHIMVGGCGKKPVLATDGNTSNFLMHLGRHHLEWYAKLIEAQEKG